MIPRWIHFENIWSVVRWHVKVSKSIISTIYRFWMYFDHPLSERSAKAAKKFDTVWHPLCVGVTCTAHGANICCLYTRILTTHLWVKIYSLVFVVEFRCENNFLRAAEDEKFAKSQHLESIFGCYDIPKITWHHF